MSSSASEFGKDLGLMHEVVITGRKSGFTSEDWGILAHDEIKLGKILSFIRNEAELVLMPKPALAPEPEVVIDPIIRVDHSVKPNYPDWIKEVLHPDLESTGPTEYNIAEVQQWLHDGQKDGKWIEGNKIYSDLKGTPDKPGDLKSHLGTRDLEEIRKKGITFFRRHFKGKVVLGWKGVARDRSDNLGVPCLCEGGDGVVRSWLSLDDVWFSHCPGLRHASYST